MERELLFARTLEQVKKQGRLQGNRIGKEQVREAFAALSLDEAQLLLVYEYLEKHHIGTDDRDVSPEDLPEAALTAEETDYLQEYLEALENLPEISEGEREALFLSAMAGERQAQRRLMEAFLPKVPDMAKIYVGQGVLLEDLIGQGNMALGEGVTLLGAAENAKEAEGMLAWCVMDAMEKLIAEGAENRNADRELEEKVNRIAEQARELAQDLRRKVTAGELAEETGIPEEEISEIHRLSGYMIEDLER